MDFTDDQLLEVFQQFDVHNHGFIGIDELCQFAEHTGFKNSDVLQDLDVDGTGEVDFEQFKIGVRALVNRVGDTPTLRRKRMKQLPPSPPVSRDSESYEDSIETSEDIDDEDDSPANIAPSQGRNSKDRAFHRRLSAPAPHRPPLLKRSSSIGQFVSLDKSRHALQQKLEDLEARHEDLQNQHEEQGEELLMIKHANAQLEDRIHSYEEQISWAEEVLAAANKDNSEATISRLTREKEELFEEYESKTQELEEQLTIEHSQRAQLERKLEDQLSISSQQEEIIARLEHQIQVLRDQVDTANEELQTKLKEIARNVEAEHVQQVTQIEEQALEESTRLVNEKKALEELLENTKSDAESQKIELETKLKQAQEKINSLEECFNDPQEFERQFVKRGLQFKKRHSNGDSLADELQGADKEELLEEIRTLGNQNTDLQDYIDRLLATVIDRIPDILEIRSRRT